MKPTLVHSSTTKKDQKDMTFNYAPYNLQDCFTPDGVEDPFKSIAARFDSTLSQAMFNFMWLAEPNLDQLGLGDDWVTAVNSFQVDVADFCQDVVDDEVLFRKLLMHPKEFYEWWQTEDHSIYDFYALYGDKAVKTISARAMQAAARLGGFVESRTDNVIRVQFGKAA